MMTDLLPMPVIALPSLFREDRESESDTIIVTSDFPDRIDVRLTEPEFPFVNSALLRGAPEYVKDWDSYVGQEPMKRELRVYIAEAIQNCDVLPHILLASGMPGAGKTTLARLIAKEMAAECVMLVPPFSRGKLYDAALSMNDGEVLFIDEIHKLADNGPGMVENLYHLMEEGLLYLEDGVHELADITVIGATTDADRLPEPVLDRFAIKPYFQPYSLPELVRITKNFCNFYGIVLSPQTMVAIARACRGTPRLARELVRGAKALQTVSREPVTPQDLLAFKQVEPDGTTRQHKAYLKAMYQFFGREREGGWEYVAGEASMMNLLRENKPGIARLERFLIEKGLVDRTSRGRRLTDRGIAAARRYIAAESPLGSE